MIKSKKAQAFGNAINYVLIGFVSAIILIAGYALINVVKEKTCKTEIAKFEIDLRNIDKAIRLGQKELLTLDVPCKADQIYFFDLNNDADAEMLNEMPIMKENLKTKSDNVFLVKSNDIKSSFYAGNFEIAYPHFICFIPKSDKISYFLEGSVNSVFVTSATEQPECTWIQVKTNSKEDENILKDAVLFKCPTCSFDINKEKNKIEQTKKNLDISRKFTLLDKKTKVEIIIEPKKDIKLRNIKFYESIPKECIPNLIDYLEERVDDGAKVDVKADPLIIWSFSEVNSQKKVSYKLKEEISEECMKLIKGLAVAQSIERE